MDSSLVFLFFILAIVGAIAVRLLSGNMDRSRISDYVGSQGGRLLECDWSPFGRGWFGSKEERIYEIVYVDAGGNKHRATCKTSMLSGVYFTEDNVVESSNRAGFGTAGETEVERLRRENEDLKRRLGQ